jgi:hypothetical protein
MNSSYLYKDESNFEANFWKHNNDFGWFFFIVVVVNVWLKWKILLDPEKWHIFWRFGPYWVQKYPFRQNRWKIRRWWVILPWHLPYLLILHKYFFQSCNSLVVLCLFDSLHRNLSEK